MKADLDMYRFTKPILWLLLALTLTACATAPKFDTSRVDKALTPAAVTADPQGTRGKIAQWGGVIIAGHNLADSTRLEVLSYPLAGDGRPDRSAPPLGRFLLMRKGYLETATYAPGRMVTAVGPVAGTQPGKIGEAEYTYPVLEADQLYLWPVGTRSNTEPDVHFGIGIGVILH